MTKALIVDDNEQNLYLLEAALKGVGYSVAQARNGAEALEAAGKEPPDIIITDILMPVMDGYELCRRWKADAGLKGIPFVVYTATYTDPRDERFALDLGADRFILKPAKIEALQTAVREALEEARRSGTRAPAPESGDAAEYKDVLFRKLQDKARELEWEVAARHKAEESMKAERDRAQNYLDMAGVMIVLLDAGGKVRLINRKGCAILGYEERDVLGRDWFSAFVPERLRGQMRAFYGKLVDGELPAQGSYENQVLTRSGGERFMIWHNTVMKEPSGGVAGVLCSGEDITERKAMEEQQAKLLRAIEQSPALVLITDAAGAMEYINPRFTEVTGYTIEDLRGRKPSYFKSGETPDAEYRRLWTTITSGGIWRGEFHNRKKDGSLYWARATISAIRDAAGKTIGFVGIKEDISAQKVLEAELNQAQKMESIGRLAGGVAHDFNNMLGAITGYAAFLMKGMPEDDARRDDVKGILAVSERAAALTHQLLLFSRKQVANPSLIDLNETVSSTAKILRRLISEDIKLETSLYGAPCVVKADAGQLGQILMNLAVNARDAMENGGTLRIAVGTAAAADGSFSGSGTAAGPLAVLKVTDTGCGMTEEVKKHAFEPFFTTKEKGKGTGLGLATVYSIIKQNGGEIDLDSAPGKGTTFLIYLPAVKPSAEEEKPKASALPLCGSEAVLLVEDEDTLRKLNERVLSSGGYEVLTAANGPEAIKALAQRGSGVDLVITDVILPGMSGREMAQKIEEGGLSRKTLYVSGYTDDEIAQHGVLSPGLAFLHKPFSPDALLLKVREVLDGPAGAGKA